jgi:uncharacterized protein YjbJ (UPF0337 family)
MNFDQIETRWGQLKVAARETLGKLTEEDWQVIDGKRDKFEGKLQQRYGIGKEEARKWADEWSRTISEEDFKTS